MEVGLVARDSEIAACFPVMSQLRSDVSREDFVRLVRMQEAQGYRLACVRDPEVTAVAGFRVGDNLAWGRFLYVDDLVTDSCHRSSGQGAALLEWLVEHAREQGCRELHLDSGVQRYDAHRFYLRHRMEIRSHHFSLVL